MRRKGIFAILGRRYKLQELVPQAAIIESAVCPLFGIFVVLEAVAEDIFTASVFARIPDAAVLTAAVLFGEKEDSGTVESAVVELTDVFVAVGEFKDTAAVHAFDVFGLLPFVRSPAKEHFLFFVLMIFQNTLVFLGRKMLFRNSCKTRTPLIKTQKSNSFYLIRCRYKNRKKKVKST